MRSFKISLYSSFILLLALFSCSEPGISPEKAKPLLNRLLGQWQVVGEQSFEEWTYSSDSSFAAVVYSNQENKKILREIIRIIEEENKVFYEATLMDQNAGKPIRFQLIGLSDNLLVFANPKHDFPKRIEYEFVDNEHIMARVSDGKGEMGKSFIINYKRVKKEKNTSGTDE